MRCQLIRGEVFSIHDGEKSLARKRPSLAEALDGRLQEWQ